MVYNRIIDNKQKRYFKMKKSLKLISAILTATISMSIAPAISANPPKSGHSIQSSQSNSVIKISSLEDLNHLRDLSNQGENFEGKTVILENDIYITKDQTKDGEPIEFKSIFKCPYDSVGDNHNIGFKGIFDGNGKTLHFNATNSNIFGSIAKGGIVKNLNITGRFEGDLEGGTVALFNFGTIDNIKIDISARCTTTSVIGVCAFNQKSGIIKNCSVKGDLSTNDMACTGICSDNRGIIESCSFSGKLTNGCEEPKEAGFMLEETGGIASFNSGLVKNCNVEANLSSLYEGKFIGCAGGIVSTNNGLIENSYFKGSIAAESPGSLTGSNYGIVRLCKSDANLKGPLAAEFTSLNMWGYESFCEYEPIKNQPQGVIDGCEFKGTVTGCVESGKIAAYDNMLSCESSLGPIHVPTITNCKINGNNAVRETDNYYKNDADERYITDPRYTANM